MKQGPADMWPVGTCPAGGSLYANPGLPPDQSHRVGQFWQHMHA